MGGGCNHGMPRFTVPMGSMEKKIVNLCEDCAINKFHGSKADEVKCEECRDGERYRNYIKEGTPTC